MLYPYANGSRGYQEDLYSIAQGNRDHAHWSGFCRSMASCQADDFDDVAKDLCGIRHANLHSADAVYAAANGEILFIEFKDDDEEGLGLIGYGQPKINSKTGKEYREVPLCISLLQKGFDSLAVAAMTVCHDLTMDEIRSRSVFIVVRRDDPPSYLATVNSLASFAHVRPSGSPVLWGLGRLRDEGYYKCVHTWTESEFRTQAVLWYGAKLNG